MQRCQQSLLLCWLQCQLVPVLAAVSVVPGRVAIKVMSEGLWCRSHWRRWSWHRWCGGGVLVSVEGWWLKWASDDLMPSNPRSGGSAIGVEPGEVITARARVGIGDATSQM